MRIEYKWTGRDLNPRPLPCEGNALPTELPARKVVFEFLFFITIQFFYLFPSLLDNKVNDSQ